MFVYLVCEGILAVHSLFIVLLCCCSVLYLVGLMLASIWCVLVPILSRRTCIAENT